MKKRIKKKGVKTVRINDKICRYFSKAEKHEIIRIWQTSGRTKQAVWEELTGQKKEHGKILKWMRQLGYKEQHPPKGSILSNMKKTPIEESDKDTFELMQKEQRIKELEQRLKESEMKAIAFSTMIDIAEKELKITIRKKYNTKPLKK